MSTSCPLCMDMRRDGESRGCREAGERDLVIKSSLHRRVYLGMTGLRREVGWGVRCADDTDFAQGMIAHPSGGAWGVESEGGVRYNLACTVQQVRGDLAAGTYPDMRVSLYPGRSTEAPPGETAGASWDEGWLLGATGVTLWL